MSASELRRTEILSEVLARKRTEVAAAAILGFSTRQTRRLLKVYRERGGSVVIHEARGRASNNGTAAGLREYALELVRSRYADFGPTLAAEMLESKDDVKVSRETLRKWMVEAGVWLSRKQLRSFHQPRLRRESTRCSEQHFLSRAEVTSLAGLLQDVVVNYRKLDRTSRNTSCPRTLSRLL